VVSLTQRKSKRDDDSVGFDLEETRFVLEPVSVEIGSGYTVAFGCDENDKPVVDVKTFGTVDMATVQRELESVFPNVRIRHLNHESSVAVVKKTRKKRK
jgi:hypothetical protein